MTDPVSPDRTGGACCTCSASRRRWSTPEAVRAAVKETTAAGHQVVPVAMLGHKADLAFMVLGPDLRQLRRFQTALQGAGLMVVDSYVSLTEVSEYAKGMPEHMLEARLHPQLPPGGKPAFCFYPMSKRREVQQNWFTLPYERAQRAHARARRLRADLRRSGAPGGHRLDRPGRLRVGRHAVRACTRTISRRSSTPCATTGPRPSTPSSVAFYTGMVTPLDDLLAGI